jgi:ferritin-like metal-binding protein YciE
MKVETLHDRYVDELNDLYSAELELFTAPPQMNKPAPAPELAQSLLAIETQPPQTR